MNQSLANAQAMRFLNELGEMIAKQKENRTLISLSFRPSSRNLILKESKGITI